MGTFTEIRNICHDKPIAYIGHKVYCPLCKGTFPIIEGVLTTTFYGKGVAVAGMKTGCGATLVPTQFTDTVEMGGRSTGMQTKRSILLAESSVSAAAPLTSATSVSGATPAAEENGQEKKIVAVFWSFGENETPVSGPSRFYVDLNLHVKTQNYSEGDVVEILLEDDKGADVIEGVKTVKLLAPVDAAGEAKLMNVFVGKTVITLSEFA